MIQTLTRTVSRNSTTQRDVTRERRAGEGEVVGPALVANARVRCVLR
jgi:hypothetical protein